MNPPTDRASQQTRSGKQRFLAIVLLSAVILAAVCFGFAQFGSGSISDSVVSIRTYDINGLALGSGKGFAAFDQGIIVTHYHLMDGETYRAEIVTESGDISFADSVICSNKRSDITILRVPDCKAPLLSKRSADALEALGFSFPSAKTLYDSRTIDMELSMEQFWGQSEHIYTVDYVLRNAHRFGSDPIKIKGYVSAADWDIYLVANADRSLNITVSKTDADDTKETKREQIFTQYDSGHSLLCQRKSGNRLDRSVTLGDSITLKGTVAVYTENNTGSDIRFLVSEVLKTEG